MNTKLKIVVHGGYVISVNDGQIHYIHSLIVCNLYGIDSRGSNIIKVEEYRPTAVNHCIYKNDYIHVYPRIDGNYSPFKLLFRR